MGDEEFGLDLIMIIKGLATRCRWLEDTLKRERQRRTQEDESLEDAKGRLQELRAQVEELKQNRRTNEDAEVSPLVVALRGEIGRLNDEIEERKRVYHELSRKQAFEARNVLEAIETGPIRNKALYLTHLRRMARKV